MSRGGHSLVQILGHVPAARRFRHEFESNGRPVLIRGGVSSWAASRSWTIDSLVDLVGMQEFELEYSVSGLFDPNICDARTKIATQKLKYREAVALIKNPGTGAYYIREAEIPNWSPLHRDLGEISLIPAGCRTFPGRLWIGSVGASSPIHFDGGDYNFLAHLVGEKMFRLYPPSETRKLYPNWSAKLPHLSKVNHLAPNLIEYPCFADAVCEEFVLEPGDLLFVPRNWWHCTMSRSPTISVNFFWQRDWLSRLLLKAAALSSR